MQTRDEVIAAVKKAAEELGRAPSLHWLVKHNRVTRPAVKKHFPEFRKCVQALRVQSQGGGYELTEKELFADWSRVVRLLKKVPSVVDYLNHGHYSHRPLIKRFKSWNDVPLGMLEWARTECREEDWNDVLEIVSTHLHAKTKAGMRWPHTSGIHFQPRILKDEPFFGPPMVKNYLLLLQPTNEQEVIFLFGGMAVKLGFAVLKIRTEYPDGMALREVAPGKWQLVKIEFEQESRNFLRHKHDPADAHLIVCWKHNWPDCPLEVIELSSLVGKLGEE